MNFVDPMLASAAPPRNFDSTDGQWIAEEKLDGHRLIVDASDGVRAWSRDGLPRVLPPHVRETLERLPAGTYDGELHVPGSRSYGVTELANADKLVYTIFDLPVLLGRSLLNNSLSERRALLEEIGLHLGRESLRVRVNPIHRLGDHLTEADVAREVWSRDGEGIIVKNLRSSYVPGKRTKDWFKVKQLRTAVLVVVAFEPGTLSYCSIARLRDSDGFETTVKVRTLADIARIERDGVAAHVGRRLRVDYQERTPDGAYRHPRWDRWEDE